jgi:hypothetical protein
MPTQISPRIAALLERTRATRGRLIFAIDATASREPTWNMAAGLQSHMFEEAAKIGNLEVQLTWYRGANECAHTPWTTDTGELAAQMRRIRCDAGSTQIIRVLEHIREENAREKVSAAIFVGDAIEEPPPALYAVATGLGVPLFCFQEGDAPVVLLNRYGTPFTSFDMPSQTVETIFRELARLTGGAWARFDVSAAARLGELLAAVAAFATGGLKALGDLRSDAARKLLTQMK